MSKPEITVSINPSYYCNLSCSFCYLTELQLRDKRKASIESIDDRLTELSAKYTIKHIDLYGGETFMLPPEYLNELIFTIKDYTTGTINVVTNGTVKHPAMSREDLYISVSFDYMVRERWEETFNNMIQLERPFTILMLASPELLKYDVDEIIQTLNLLTMCENVEIKPYSSNQANHLAVTNHEYEDFVKRFMQSKTGKNFRFANEDKIFNSLDGYANSYSDDHIYITPEGSFAVLEFDESGHEYFLPLASLDEYAIWTSVERHRTEKHPVCSTCTYKGTCLSEHLKPVKPVNDSCDGFKDLLDWAKITFIED